jgi:hypothetical protein
MAILVLPANGRDIAAPPVEGCGEIHVVHPDGRCDFVSAAGIRCAGDHGPPPAERPFGFAGTGAAGFGEIGDPTKGGRFGS